MLDVSRRPSDEASMDLAAEPPDPAVAERRLELVQRLAGMKLSRDMSAFNQDSVYESQSSCEPTDETPMSTLCLQAFSVVDKRADKIRTFEWWPTRKVDAMLAEAGGRDPDRVSSVVLDTSVHVQLLGQMLEECGVDTSRFSQGDAKTMERFAEEVERGFSQLMLDASKHKALVRVVEVVLLRISVAMPGGDELFLIVSADEQPDGRVRGDLNRLPGTKKLPHENVRCAAWRTLAETQLDECTVAFDFDRREVFEVEEESPSYPGVRTIYRKEIVPCKLKTYGHIQFPGSWELKGDRSTKFLSWLTEEECARRNVKLSAPTVEHLLCNLVPAPIGLKREALGRYLKTNGVDPSIFGKGKAKTLTELSNELTMGKCSLTRLSDGRVARIVDVVVLKISKGESETLVVSTEVCVDGEQQDGGDPTDAVVLNRLPGSKRRPGENHFLTAKRVLHRQLNVSENQVSIDAESVRIIEEEKDSPSYPGLHTIYLRRVIPVRLDMMRQTSMRSDRAPYHAMIPEEPAVDRLSSGPSVKTKRCGYLQRMRRSVSAWSFLAKHRHRHMHSA